MSFRALDAKRTAAASVWVAVGLSLTIYLGASVFASSKLLTIVGGLLSSFVFAGLLLAIGNTQKETKWPEVIGCLLIAGFVASRVHGVSITFCVMFSALWLFWISSASDALHK